MSQHTVKLFNTMGRKVEPFVPIVPGHAGIYTCGPTVYSYAHVGNMRAYVFADVLRRTLELAGYEVRHVMNITDVGHLTSDADEGEDKMLVGMRREGLTAWEIAAKYTEAFFRHTAMLNIIRPTVVCPATQHIGEQVALIQRLEANGLTYQTEDGIYFDTGRFPKYGELAQLDIEGLRAGERVDVGDKQNKTDFALWKFSPTNQQRDMEWDSPWGKGFPGWHLECSAMAMKHLGEHFDIHTGGIDHIAVHHNNEIAQSEGATGHPYVNTWMHCEFLQLRGSAKMSKSKGDSLTVDTLVEKGFEPRAFRYLCLTSHYRGPMTFSMELMVEATTAFDRLNKQIVGLKKAGAAPVATHSVAFKRHLDGLHAAVFNDLNTAIALVNLRDVLADDALTPGEKLELVRLHDTVLGLDLGVEHHREVSVPEDVTALVNAREDARREKQWARADELRREILAKGFVVEDTASGARISAL